MQKKRSGSTRYFFYIILGIIALYTIFFGIRILFLNLDFLTIEKIEFSGNTQLEINFLENLSADFLEKNLFAVSNIDVQKKFENVVRIKKIKSTKIFPNKLKIIIEERIGKFYLKTANGKIIPLDKDKIVLDKKTENLPIISLNLDSLNIFIGQKITSTFVDSVFAFENKLSNADADFINNISEFYPHENEIYLIDKNNGNKIIFGNGEIDKKLMRFKYIEENRTFQSGSIIDLRFKDEVIIKSEES
ncbi:MAG: FtsQ-type POTRA domain-containing protein [Candidatus Cloacimonetes bacterium]|jgi:cell division septal protein FtsQ|nr:FtsQ-type POTRA domain-containing protein [Candidatus Cloacimonadota bacterium]MBT6993972.1 FtsQ-type POTRA domain-containing protein [Candidatus Cloacimonadota bacterium]